MITSNLWRWALKVVLVPVYWLFVVPWALIARSRGQDRLGLNNLSGQSTWHVRQPGGRQLYQFESDQ